MRVASPEEESAQIADSWYIPPKPEPPSGWLVFSRDFILRGLRGAVHDSQTPPQPMQRALCEAIRAGIALLQGTIMLLAAIPLISSFLEIFVTFFPRGALGAVLRASFWKARLRRLGQDTIIERGIEIWGAGHVEIGSRCHIDTFVRLAAGEAGFGQKGQIRIGDFTHIGPRAHLAGRGGIDIGDFVAIEARVHLYSASNAIMLPHAPGQLASLSHMAPPDRQHVVEAPIRIADYAVVGFASLLLPGAALGAGAVAHPFSVISSSYLPYANLAGPGRVRQNGWRRPLRLDPRRERAAHVVTA